MPAKGSLGCSERARRRRVHKWRHRGGQPRRPGVAAGAGTVLCSAVEHPAVLQASLAAGGRTVGVDHRGVVDLGALAEILDEKVRLVSVMLVNNETGVRQPLEAVISLVHERAPAALVHTDAVQAFGWLDVAALTADADLVSVSAHKFGARKVWVLSSRETGRRHCDLSCVAARRSVNDGRARRTGRHCRHGGGGRATVRDRERRACAFGSFRRGWSEDLGAVPGVHEAVPRDDRIDASAISHRGVEAEELLVVLDELGVCASAGSACASGAIQPSHVLLAMGRTIEEAKRHVRLSLGHATTTADIDAVLLAFPEAVERLRPAAPVL